MPWVAGISLTHLQQETGELVPINLATSIGVDFHEKQPEILVGQLLDIR